jgi:hypothetical protein
VEESSRDKPNDSSRPRPRPISLSSKVVAPIASVFSPKDEVLEQRPADLEEASPARERITFRAKTALVLQETRRSGTATGVPVIDVSEKQEPPDAPFSPSTDSSYNSAMNVLSFGVSTESMDVNDFSSDSSYDSSESDDLGEPSIEDDDDSLSESGEEKKSDQAKEKLRQDENKSYQVRDLVSGPLIDSDSLEEQNSDKADYDWQALRNKEKQRLDLEKNESDKKRLDLGKKQDAVEWRKPPPHRDYPWQSARVSYGIARTGVLESRSSQEKLKLTKAPAASSRMQELIGCFEPAAGSRIQELIGRFERKDSSSEPEPKPALDILRKTCRRERENRQDMGGDRVDSISSSFSSTADVSDFPTRHPMTSPTQHSFFWRSHPRVESSENKTDMSSVSTVEMTPQLVDTSRSTDADSESYVVRVDSSFDSKNMADHQPIPSIRTSVSSERRFL